MEAVLICKIYSNRFEENFSNQRKKKKDPKEARQKGKRESSGKCFSEKNPPRKREETQTTPIAKGRKRGTEREE